jgi:nucleoside-diphosphate-sugar epimerase
MTTTTSQQKSAFVLGAGFIGMSVIDELLKANYQVTALVRRQAHADQLEAIGVSPVIGTLEDKDLITKQSSVSDVVIHTATADHLPSAEAILRGVQQRAEKGQQAIYIHNSGAGVLSDGAAGRFKTDKVFSDDSRDDVDSVPDTNPHRNVDNAIVVRQKEIGSGARIAIMLPPLIYGCTPPPFATHPSPPTDTSQMTRPTRAFPSKSPL